MKRITSLLLSAAMLLLITACAAEAPHNIPKQTTAFNAGSYTASAWGFGGNIEVTVTLSDDQIEKIEVAKNSETVGVGSIAVEKIPLAVVANQSLAVDAVSGATTSSKALIEAITEALALSGADISALQSTSADVIITNRKAQVITADVVVIGAGAAGMTAALEAKSAGKSVVVLEKMPVVGGNTAKAAGAMNAAQSYVQKEAAVEDSVESFIKDTMKSGGNINNKGLVTVLAEDSASAIEWLASIDAPLTELAESDGVSSKRAHRPENGAALGAYLSQRLLENLKKNEVPVYLNTEATDLVLREGEIIGVEARGENTDYLFNSKAVIIATGGFGANKKMITRYRVALKGFITTNSSCATGDGIVMAQNVGAQVSDIDSIQTHPLVHQRTGRLLDERLTGEGAILVNSDGERFADETGTRDAVCAAEIEQEGGYAYLVFDQALRERVAAVEDYINSGIVAEGGSVAELADKIGVDFAALKANIDSWNEAVADKNDKAFERDAGMEYDISKAPFYAIRVAPGVHHTMGGITINTNAEVIGSDNLPIAGLFAAGEVTGGIHGDNCLEGNAVTDAIVFGRKAGQSAAAYAEKTLEQHR